MLTAKSFSKSCLTLQVSSSFGIHMEQRKQLTALPFKGGTGKEALLVIMQISQAISQYPINLRHEAAGSYQTYSSNPNASALEKSNTKITVSKPGIQEQLGSCQHVLCVFVQREAVLAEGGREEALCTDSWAF